MKPRTIGIAAAILAAVVTLWVWLHFHPAVPTEVPSPHSSVEAITPAPTPSVSAAPTIPPLPPLPIAAPTIAQALSSASAHPLLASPIPNTRPPNSAPATTGGATKPANIDRATAIIELQKVRTMLASYHTLMSQNPVGTNAEIMKAIMGGNPHGATLGPPPGQSLNGNGELVDPWGTPYFFHQLSADDMEIHSAGPDKVMWTSDDLVLH